MYNRLSGSIKYRSLGPWMNRFSVPDLALLALGIMSCFVQDSFGWLHKFCMAVSHLFFHRLSRHQLFFDLWFFFGHSN